MSQPAPTPQRPCVLVFAGHDPSGGAGIAADIEAIAAQGAHALTIITALTVQDNEHVYAVQAVDTQMILQQALTLTAKIPLSVIKIGIVAHKQNAAAIARFISGLRQRQPALQVILDPVLGSGRGDSLSLDDAVAALAPLLALATLITPNLPELARLAPNAEGTAAQVAALMQHSAAAVLVKGGHADEAQVHNVLYRSQQLSAARSWQWPRLEGQFHGSGCTLAAAISGALATGMSLEQALDAAQIFTQRSLAQAYAITDGQLIPARHF